MGLDGSLLALAASMFCIRGLLGHFDPSRDLGGWNSWKTPKPIVSRSAVLITGAGTGLGLAAALRLSQNGWIVFAGVFSKEEYDTLSQMNNKNLIPLQLNVTDEHSIQLAIEKILSTSCSLIAVVNNANIMSGPGPLEFVNVNSECQKCFDVGCFGALRIVQRTLPLLRSSSKHGRIIMISSTAAVVPSPFHGVYSGTKAAMEAMTDVLRREIDDVYFTIIEPEMIQTGAAETWPSLLSKFWTEKQDKSYSSLRKTIEKQHISLVKNGLTAEQAARGIVHAVTCEIPPHRYRLGMNSVFASMLNFLPTHITDFVLKFVRENSS